MHYFGAGTSGRLGVLDAAELAPTFNSPRHWFCAHLAGGPDAMWRAVEDAEDDDRGGAVEAASCVRAGDLVVGLAASGRTPYVLGALAAARAKGASTVLLCANPEAEAARSVDVFIGVDTGPEVVTGSTRMKAGTAQKLVLNTFSTAVMVRLGRVYSNLMIDMVATNAKLRGRMISILVEATGCSEELSRQALSQADGDLKTGARLPRLGRRDRRRPGRVGPLGRPGARRPRPARLLAPPAPGSERGLGLFIWPGGNHTPVDEPTGPPVRVWQ